MDCKLNVTPWCVLVARKVNSILRYINISVICKSWEMFFLLYSAVVIRPLEYCAQLWALHFEKDIDELAEVQQRS